MMKRNLRVGVMVVLCAYFTITSLAGQNIRFLKEKHDFGEVHEEAGPVKHEFLFVNTGSESLAIENVEASCGCTTPAWTDTALMPGDTGFVVAEYNPLNRPGKFEKSLNVSYVIGQAGSATATLYIEGMVSPRAKTMEDELPLLMGQIRMKYKALNMGRVTTEKVVTESFKVYNEGDSAVRWLEEKSSIPGHVELRFEPVVLEPKTLGEITLTFDPVKKADLGFVSDNIRLYTDEAEDEIKELHVIATISEYFPPRTEEEMKKAPKLTFDKTQHDFGNVNEGTTVVTDFNITNNGKEDLEIRSVKPNCGCTVAKLKKKSISPGETMTFEVSFDTSGRQGRQYKTVTVFSNDPSAPSQMISIKADVN
ncbi:MAG: DUF1573 domain-containing protein [Marinoscillum sp.]|uniref:DUF1573 domain-containing protein n=1 Tax=Marinoscillum sp. TaxID=2024838 RepID=UPI0032F9BC2E